MKILTLGIGNIMFSDEGIGVHLCYFLQKKYKFTSKEHTLDFVDGGTMAEHLIPIMARYDYVILLDCISADDSKIGDVYFFDFEKIPKKISWQGSAHEVEMLQTLTMMDLVGDRPKTSVLGIIPKVVGGTSLSLSSEVKKGSKVMEKIFVKHIKELGFEVETLYEDLDIQEVANSFNAREVL
ncbi:MAG: HyaD/HybD family hydrogenase maturation endopeptidase [Campylobacteraceae bacterium]